MRETRKGGPSLFYLFIFFWRTEMLLFLRAGLATIGRLYSIWTVEWLNGGKDILKKAVVVVYNKFNA